SRDPDQREDRQGRARRARGAQLRAGPDPRSKQSPCCSRWDPSAAHDCSREDVGVLETVNSAPTRIPTARGMKLALLASSYLPSRGGLERYVDQLAHGLARRGVEVEILAQVSGRGPVYPVDQDGVTTRRFPATVGPLRFALTPSLWERMRATAAEFDV